ncbi:beta-lactam response regulator transcription factor BlrA [Aeromonas enteropelogenes]|uniref:Two-component system response regulator n=1 Tax=Aeromonas enteropelogenes TaxID=29489 RepID=A0A175VFD6_AEREN|nr:beta-lactam response regulator transcription factor BlrA [Aeromonas enteropelogenes]KXU79406.1 two-component system response regulator [Aeromonas enteropelogenes]MBL0523085.1 beta-lactam response regulator transcription factor BlrA [Aeromonas enteropelogenes]UCA11628.1 beta-lactam response regulator transcription factor BlrA [Aeromonas enteropelogenes]
MQKRLIWLVEDEASIADTLIYALQTDGFEVEWFMLGQQLLTRLAQAQPDFLILDVGLPDISGFELCKQVRARSDVPLMFLTARSEEIDRLIGLEIGADDYVAKPFSPREVCARVRVILRRSQPTSPKQSAALTLDEERARIHFHGQPLMLTRYEYLLLKTLMQSPGRVYSRQQLMDLVWQDAEESLDRTVDTHIKTIRAKLREQDPDANLILTHRGLGYSLELA